MTRKELYKNFINHFSNTMPEAKTELNYGTPFELLVAVMLSAQCTDKRVNMVTPVLFNHFPTAEQMAEASVEEILADIKSISYPNSKAAHLSRMAKMLLAEFGGNVPDTLEQLTLLPGVGRKTANVVLSVVFDKAEMPVDTHVFRVSHRIGLVPERCATPLSVEKELKKNIPPEHIPIAHHWLILHGRYVCTSRKPHCQECGISQWCKKANINQEHTHK